MLPVLCSTVFVVAAMLAQGTKEMRWQLESGAKHRYERDATVSFAVTSSSGVREARTRLRITYTDATTAVSSSGTATIERTIERIRIWIESGTLRRRFDSAKESEPARTKLIKRVFGLVGKRFRYRVDARGRVQPSSEIGSDLPAELRTVVFGSGRPLFELPEAPVRAGGSWKTKTDMTLPLIRLAGKFDHKLESVEEAGGSRVATITSKAKLEVELLEPHGIDFETRHAHETQRHVLALDHGHVIESELALRIELATPAETRKLQMSLVATTRLLEPATKPGR